VQLSLKADYALRTLIFLATHPEETVSTERISQAYGISKHHLVRVVQALGEHGYVQRITGRHGGLRLALSPSHINLGAVVRHTESNLDLVECFNPQTNTCPIAGACLLERFLAEALECFLRELDRHTLAELLHNETLARRFIQIEEKRA
jgi:Rrf2 family transcriptional regulator, nitric oxide-sensitive transcriptional repressor